MGVFLIIISVIWLALRDREARVDLLSVTFKILVHVLYMVALCFGVVYLFFTHRPFSLELVFEMVLYSFFISLMAAALYLGFGGRK